MHKPWGQSGCLTASTPTVATSRALNTGMVLLTYTRFLSVRNHGSQTFSRPCKARRYFNGFGTSEGHNSAAAWMIRFTREVGLRRVHLGVAFRNRRRPLGERVARI
jgi:hypothetical protein